MREGMQEAARTPALFGGSFLLSPSAKAIFHMQIVKLLLIVLGIGDGIEQ
jgi:hypothetical protein